MLPLHVIEGVSNLKPQGRVLGKQEGDDLAPVFRMEVEGVPIQDDVLQFVKSVEYETTVDMADLLRIVVNNPGLVDPEVPDWNEHKIFQPGNEASLFVGYGSAERPEDFVGRVRWAKHLPNFPREEMPTTEVKGYDFSHLMMDNSGIIFNAGKVTQLEQKRPVDEKDNQGQVFANVTHSDVVLWIAQMYGLEADIDRTERRENVILKKGMKHYEIVRGLANINLRDFWIDYNPTRKRWVLHWKKLNRESRSAFTFRYMAGDGSAQAGGTLFEAAPEYGVRETINEATILIFDKEAQRWVSAIEIEDFSGPSPLYHPGGGESHRIPSERTRKVVVKKGKRSKTADKANAMRKNARDIVDTALDNAAAFRISAAGVAIDVLPPSQRFESPAAAAEYLRRWFLDRQDNFLVVRGVVVGVPSLRARQTHTLLGLGKRFDGDYFFTSVRHVLDDGGYRCEFTANRVIVH